MSVSLASHPVVEGFTRLLANYSAQSIDIDQSDDNVTYTVSGLLCNVRDLDAFLANVNALLISLSVKPLLAGKTTTCLFLSTTSGREIHITVPVHIQLFHRACCVSLELAVPSLDNLSIS